MAAKPSSMIARYRRDLRRSAEAVMMLEATRRQIIEAGCPHPEEYQGDWVKTVYQVGPIVIGKHCTICDNYLSDFGTMGWNRLQDVEYENINCCPHREEWHTEYKWHHGYGKYINGLECGNCRARKSFPSQGYWNTYAEWSQWRYDRDDD